MNNLKQTFQCPNEYVDYYCSHLSGSDFKVLIAATRKIIGWQKNRKTMADHLSYKQLMDLTGIRNRNIIAKALRRLSKLGILKRIGSKNCPTGQKYRLVRFTTKKGQVELFENEQLEEKNVDNSKDEKSTRIINDTRVVSKMIPGSYHKGYIQNPIRNPIRNTIKRSNGKTTFKKQMELNFKEPKQVVQHLREIAASGNGQAVAAAADLTLRILEQLWQWGFIEETLKSWKWLLWAAWKWPKIVDEAWGEVKSQQLEYHNVRRPGALLTWKIKEYTANGKIPS